MTLQNSLGPYPADELVLPFVLAGAGSWMHVEAEANLPGVRLHDLRHSFASHAAARSETLASGKLG